jgi:hypothetical protein
MTGYWFLNGGNSSGGFDRRASRAAEVVKKQPYCIIAIPPVGTQGSQKYTIKVADNATREQLVLEVKRMNDRTRGGHGARNGKKGWKYVLSTEGGTI